MHPLAVIAGLLAGALLRAGHDEEPAPRRTPAGKGRGRPVTGTFYRITAQRRVTLADFLSNRAKRLPPRGIELEDPDIRGGISVYARRREAKDRARRFGLGAYIATLEIPAGTPITGRRTGRRRTSHWTLWGSPDEFLRCVAGPAVQVDELPD
jgi:hypothetical protein